MRAKFNEIFIKGDLLPLFTSKYVQIAFDLRQQADYDLDTTVSIEEAQTLIENTCEFYKISKAWLDEAYNASE